MSQSAMYEEHLISPNIAMQTINIIAKNHEHDVLQLPSILCKRKLTTPSVFACVQISVFLYEYFSLYMQTELLILHIYYKVCVCACR